MESNPTLRGIEATRVTDDIHLFNDKLREWGDDASGTLAGHVDCDSQGRLARPSRTQSVHGANRRIAITTATNKEVAVASTSAAPNPMFHAADRLLAHENTIDAISPKAAAAAVVIRTVVNICVTEVGAVRMRSARARARCRR